MATNLCGTTGANTGSIDCDPVRGTPQMIIPGAASFSTSDYADQTTMDAAIVSKLKLNTGNSQKLFPFPIIQGAADKTVAAKTATLGYGLEFKLVRGRPGYEFDVLAGSSLEKKLMVFDKKQVPLFILDDVNQVAGKLDASSNFIGPKWLVSVEPRPYGDAQNAKSTKVTISIVDPTDFVENAKFYVTALTSSSLVGLKDVTLSEPSAHVSNVYKIKMKISDVILGGDLDIYDDYGALIAALTFTAGTGVGYATALTITSVAVDVTNKALTVTFDSTQFTALSAGAKIRLTPPTAAVLDAAGVTGVELGSIILTK